MKETIALLQILQKMSTDTYLQCKYTMQAASKEQHRAEEFVDKLFSVADKRRPLLIGTQKGGAA